MTARPKAALAMAGDLPDRLFTAAQRDRLAAVADLSPAPLTEFDSPASRAVLGEAEVLITGWESPMLTGELLSAAPALRAVLHTGGSVKGHLHAAVWERGIQVSTAAQANAKPVAEYTVAMILLSGKSVHAAAAQYARRRAHVDMLREFPGTGNYRRRVGIIGASRIGRLVIELLAPFDLEISVYDPYLTAEEAARLGVERCGLDELMARCGTISVHAPQIPETDRMIGRRRLALMRDGAVLINTSRGTLIDQDALAAELASGRIDAVIDTTDPDVLPPEHPFYAADHLLLTPHLAGSQGNELHRLAESVLCELERYVSGRPLRHLVALAELSRIA